MEFHCKAIKSTHCVYRAQIEMWSRHIPWKGTRSWKLNGKLGWGSNLYFQQQILHHFSNFITYLSGRTQHITQWHVELATVGGGFHPLWGGKGETGSGVVQLGDAGHLDVLVGQAHLVHPLGPAAALHAESPPLPDKLKKGFEWINQKSPKEKF